MSEADVINQKPFMKLFSVSAHPSKPLHLSPIMTLCAHVCATDRHTVSALGLFVHATYKLYEAGDELQTIHMQGST